MAMENGTKLTTMITDNGMERPTETDRPTVNEKGTNNDDGKAHTHSESRGSGESRGVAREMYGEELTVDVEVEGKEVITMMDLLREVKKVCGGVVGCRVKGDRSFEITMRDERGRSRLIDGIRVKGAMVHARDIVKNELVVSFINLPVYLKEKIIIEKLEEWGVKPMSAIKRRMWPGTDIADGTRYLKVKFNEEVRSLPYSVKFETLRGAEYFRVIHDRQIRVCRLCIKPGHIFRECPEFKCFKCNKTGHYARECEGRREMEQEDVSGRRETEQEDVSGRRETEREDVSGRREAEPEDRSGRRVTEWKEGEGRSDVQQTERGGDEVDRRSGGEGDVDNENGMVPRIIVEEMEQARGVEERKEMDDDDRGVEKEITEVVKEARRSADNTRAVDEADGGEREQRLPSREVRRQEES
ncbi:Gag polyprotein [Merluccius polli]|uniref:Gag polyprotein n=1 Tax=Merluccius polli TaxID=89951 RepID=A0AA47NR46_MERPO|nr:Gag polyprotein [Merluccius polli]